MAQTPLNKAKKMAGRYNLFISLCWTFLCVGPAVWYFYLYMPLGWLWVIVPTVLLPFFLPATWLDHYAVSSSRRFYERIGVRGLLAYVQHGRWVNKAIRKHYPGYRVVYDNASIQKKIRETYMFERFHYGLLLAFIIVTAHAISGGWMMILILCNIGYNVYPILMQQYVRLRLKTRLK